MPWCLAGHRRRRTLRGGPGLAPACPVSRSGSRPPEAVARVLQEIVEWEPDRRLRLRMHEFSVPLSRLATGFVETWEFQPVGSKTKIIRWFKLYAKSILAWPLILGYFFVPTTGHCPAVAANEKRIVTQSQVNPPLS